MKPKPTCKFCGSKMTLHRPDLALMEFNCGTGIATEVGHGILWSENQSMECLKSERTRLAARVAELERELEQAKADRARAAMDARNPLMAQLAELEARCKRLEEVGDMIVAEYMVVDPEKSAWKQAKEAKP